MKFVIGIEASPLIDELTDFRSLLMSETKIKEIYERLFIFDSLIEAELAKEILNEGEIFEEWHNLIVFSDGQEGECFLIMVLSPVVTRYTYLRIYSVLFQSVLRMKR